jgi:hypothetical protein
MYNQLRTGTAVIALVLLSIMAVGHFEDRRARSEERQPQLSGA